MSAHSIRQRLKNRADELGLEFQQALQYYAIERFLYRLSLTAWADQLVVKGATMLRVWKGSIARPTRDIDFLGRLKNRETSVREVLTECLGAHVKDDGLRMELVEFSEEIAIDGEYPGVRSKIRGDLHGARFSIIVDVGIGDATEPDPAWVEYPVMLDGPAPRILAYAPETAVAEKFAAIVSLGLVNSRLKDYYDIWMLGEASSISPTVLLSAVRATFKRRGTAVPDKPPPGLTEEFWSQEATLRMWRAFVGRMTAANIEVPQDLQEVVQSINRLFQTVYETEK